MKKRIIALALVLTLAISCLCPVVLAEEKNVLRVITHRTWADQMQFVSRAVCTGWHYWANTLLHYDYTENYIPELAKSYEWAEDGETIIFHLQDNAYFTDGSLMTAADVAFSYQQHIDAPTAFNNVITNFIDSVTVIDDFTVSFHCYTTSPRLWEAFYNLPIICKAAYEADPEGYTAMPFGTGGWELTYADPTTYEYRLERRDDSWWWDWYGYKSNIDEIIITQNSEESSRISALRSGEVDCIESVSADAVPVLESEGFFVNQESAINYNMLGFNVREGKPLHDINLRKAISYAIDRQAIVDALLGGTNYVYTWPCRNTFTGWQDTNIYEYDPAYAQELLAQSGYNGETLELIVCVSYIVNASECAQAVAAYLSAVGINVNVSVLESVTFNELEFAGKYDINFIDLSGSVSENLKFVWEIFGHDQFATGYIDSISGNLLEWADILDSTLDEEVQREYRVKFYQEMADNYAPYVFLWADATRNATTKNISDIDWEPTIMSQYYVHANKN